MWMHYFFSTMCKFKFHKCICWCFTQLKLWIFKQHFHLNCQEQLYPHPTWMTSSKLWKSNQLANQCKVQSFAHTLITLCFSILLLHAAKTVQFLTHFFLVAIKMPVCHFNYICTLFMEMHKVKKQMCSLMCVLGWSSSSSRKSNNIYL